MSDVYLDPATFDLWVGPNGETRLTTPLEGAAQRLRVGLGLWKGEYPLDLDQGIPYKDILGRKDGGASLAAAQRAEIVGAPEVASLDAFSVTLDVRRNATTRFRATTVQGDVLEPDAFTVPT